MVNIRVRNSKPDRQSVDYGVVENDKSRTDYEFFHSKIMGEDDAEKRNALKQKLLDAGPKMKGALLIRDLNT